MWNIGRIIPQSMTQHLVCDTSEALQCRGTNSTGDSQRLYTFPYALSWKATDRKMTTKIQEMTSETFFQVKTRIKEKKM